MTAQFQAADPQRSLSLGALALEWLLFEPRILQAEGLALAAAAADTAAPDSVLSLSKVRGSGESESRGSLTAQFLDRVLELGRGLLSVEDANETLRQLGPPDGSLVGWFRHIIDTHGIKISLHSRAPTIELASLKGWVQATSQMDPDSLICFAIAERGRSRELKKLSKWSAVVRVTDHDLEALLNEGVSDMHLHLGGLRNAQLTWLNLMVGDLHPLQLPRYSPREFSKLASNPQALARRGNELKRIERLRHCLAANCDSNVLIKYFVEPLGKWFRADAHSVSEQKDSTIYTSSSMHQVESRRAHRLDGLLASERAMLARGFASLMAQSNDAQVPDKQLLSQRRRLEHALDIYVSTKCAFLRLHQQGIVTNPGLGAHRDFTHGTKPIPQRLSTWKEESRAFTRIKAYEHAESLFYLLQSQPALKRVELRLAPASHHTGYARFLTVWREVEALFNLGKSPLSIRFAVHFKRSLDHYGEGDDAYFRFLRELDRDTAALHRFRLQSGNTPRHMEMAAKIARIDFAGQERDIFPSRAAFSMNLLRGEAKAIAVLDNTCDEVLHREWLRLRASDALHTSFDVPTLGITCHAGEDYAHPLEGTYAVITAANALNMRAGDSIGHGLALGRNVERFHRDNGHHVLTTAGEQFDALVWLHQQLRDARPTELSQFIGPLEAWIWGEAERLYSRTNLPATIRELAEVAQLRAGPVPIQKRLTAKLRARSGVARTLHDCEIRDPKCRAARRKRIGLAPILFEITPAIEWAQHWVASQLAERGIVLEFNPSSNWRVSQARSPGEVPFADLLVRFRDFILATINSDNAGAYGTRIENEYAITYDMLRAKNLSRAEALRILERLRIVGLRHLA